MSVCKAITFYSASISYSQSLSYYYLTINILIVNTRYQWMQILLYYLSTWSVDMDGLK